MYYILTFIIGSIFGCFITWLYNQITDKIKIVKFSYNFSKQLFKYNGRLFKRILGTNRTRIKK